jgi:4-hydroxybenzoate polyprenyltransferase
MTAAPLPDAAPANWVDRHAPAWARPWLRLGRFDRPTGIWLLMLPGWQGIALAGAEAGRWPDVRLLAEFLVGAALMRAAGCAYNDIVDRDIDSKVARTAKRPIPAGEISVRQAWGFVVVCSLVSFLILLTLSPTAIALGVLSLALVAAYPFMKRITWWPQAWLGLTFNWGALLGYAAATGPSLAWILYRNQLSGPVGFNEVLVSTPSLLLYAGGVFWTLGYDTIYAIQDLEDDALAGVKSSARKLGTKAPRAVMAFYWLAVVLAGSAATEARLDLLFVPGVALYATHLVLQARRVKVDEPQVALALFKSNTWAGLILFAGLALGGVRL